MLNQNDNRKELLQSRHYQMVEHLQRMAQDTPM